MKAKKTIQLHSSIFIAISCFMISWQASAQGYGTRTGTNLDGYVINNDNSYHWTLLRLQTSNDRGWTMVNNGDLWWGFNNGADHGNPGTERMRLTDDGNLGIGTSDPDGNLHVAGADNDGITAALVVESTTYGQVMLLDGNEIDALQGSLRLNHNSGYDVLMGTQGGNVGIGTDSPVEKLYVDGGNIGTSGILKVQGTGDSHFSGNLGIGTTTPRGTLDVDGSGDIYLVDDPVNGGGIQILFAPGNLYLAPYNGSDISYIQAKRQNSTGSSHMRFRTFGNGQSNDAMHIDDQGNIGINNTAPTEKLEVSGTVKATSFVSSAGSFPDYVFAADYKITPLSELEIYVKQHNRLPNMPSEQEVVEKGLNIPEVTIKSVENIETIYLHLIRMEKEIKALQQENAALKQQLKKGR